MKKTSASGILLADVREGKIDLPSGVYPGGINFIGTAGLVFLLIGHCYSPGREVVLMFDLFLEYSGIFPF